MSILTSNAVRARAPRLSSTGILLLLMTLALSLVTAPTSAREVPLDAGDSSIFPPTLGFDNYTAGDVDGDGDIDYLRTSFDFQTGGSLDWIENENGDASSWALHVIDSGESFSNANLVDLNRDGLPDVIAGDSGLDRWYYTNQGDGSFTGATLFSFGGGPAAIGDFNQDGWPDVVSSYQSKSSGIVVSFNDRDGTFSNDQFFDSGFFSTGSGFLAVADVDCDGDDDILLSGAIANDNTALENGMSLLRNDGYSKGFLTLTAVQIAGTALSDAGPIQAADLNVDGLPDFAHLIFDGTGYDVVFGINRGDGTFAYPLAQGERGVFNFDLADFDRDGDLDVALMIDNTPPGRPGDQTESDDSPHTPSRWGNRQQAADTARGSLIEWKILDNDRDFASLPLDEYFVVRPPSAASFANQVLAADFDSDNLPDLTLFHNDGKANFATLAENEDLHREAFFPTLGILGAPGASMSQLLLEDLDCDGYDELIFVNPAQNAISVCRSLAGAYGAAFSAVADVNVRKLVIGDVDKDGRKDFVWHTGNSVQMARNTTTRGNQPSFGNVTTLDSIAGLTDIELVDFSQDGYLDIVVLDGTSGDYAMLTNNGEFSPGTFNTAFEFGVPFEHSLTPTQGMRAGNFSASGEHPIEFVGSSAGSNSIFILKTLFGDLRSGENRGFGTRLFLVSDQFAAVEFRVGDGDNDGDNDIFARSANGTIAYFENTINETIPDTTRFDGTFTTLASGLTAGSQFDIGDIDGDGDLDVMTVGQDRDRFEQILNRGDGTFEAGTEIRPFFGNGDLLMALGDLDRDDRVDLFSSSSSTNQLRITANKGGQYRIEQRGINPAVGSVGNSESTVIFSFDMHHNGRTGDPAAELASIDFSFTGTSTVRGSTPPLTQAQMSALFDSVSLWRDTNGDNVINVAEDIMVALVTDYSSISGGVLRFNIADDQFVAATPFATSPGVYGLVVSTTSNVSAAGIDSFGARLAAPTPFVGENFDYDTPIFARALVNDIGSGTIAVQGLPEVSLTSDGFGATEGEAIALSVSVNPPIDDNYTITYSVTNQTASNADYTLNPSTGAFTILGPSGGVAMVALEDNLYEPGGSESFLFEITGVTSGNAILGPTTSASVNIIDGDTSPTLTLTSDGDVSEGGGPVTLTATLSHATTQNVSFQVQLQGSSTATAPADHDFNLGIGAIAAGSLSTTFTMNIVEDALYEGDEVADYALTNIVNANPGTDTTESITIFDNDSRPVLSFETTNATFGEADGRNTLRLLLSEVAGVDVTFDLEGGVLGTAQGNGTDFDLSFPGGGPTGHANGGPELVARRGDPDLSFLSMTIPAGATFVDFSFDIIDDLIDEDDEDAILDIASLTNATLDSKLGSATYRITDNDNPPTVDFGNSGSALNEGGSAFTTVVLSGASGKEITLSVIGTRDDAVDGGTDYDITETKPFRGGSSVALTFAPGETTKFLEIPTTDDGLYELDEEFTVSFDLLTNVTLGSTNPNATYTIRENGIPPFIDFVTNPVTVAEDAGSATLTLELDSVSGSDVTGEIMITSFSTATDTEDYTLQSPTTFTIPAGSTTTDIDFSIVDDLLDEEDIEIIDVEVFNIVGAQTSIFVPSPDRGGQGGGGNLFGAVEIQDNDAMPTVGFEETVVSVDEGDGTRVLNIVLSEASGRETEVEWSSTGGTAVGFGQDYTVNQGTVVSNRGVEGGFAIIPAGQTVVPYNFIINDDSIDEDDETAPFEINFVTNLTIDDTANTQTVTIVDNDAAPDVFFTIASDNVPEEGEKGSGVYFIELAVIGETERMISVDVVATGGSAVGGGGDYDFGPTTVMFLPEDEGFGYAEVTIIDDLLDEFTEDITFELQNPVALNPTGQTTFALDIIDNDPEPQIFFSSPTSSFNEDAGQVAFGVEIDAPSGKDITVQASVAGGTATNGSDFSSAGPPTIMISAGATSAPVILNIVDDLLDENDETINYQLQSPSNASIGSPATSQVTIVDNDDPPTIFFNPTSFSVTEDGGTATGFVELGAASGRTVTADVVDTLTGDAVNPDDYTFSTTSLAFNPGETVMPFNVAITDDGLVDTPFFETVIFTLEGVTNATYDTNDATLTIIDDDLTLSASWSSTFEFITEGASVTLDLQLDQTTPEDVDLEFTIFPGSAILGSDYTYDPISGQATIFAGTDRTQVEIETFGDSVDEGDEQFTLFLTNASAAHVTVNLGARFSDIVIVDNTFDLPYVEVSNISGDQPTFNQFTSVYGDDAEDFLGGSLSGVTLGDLNGDGFDDVIVGAYGADKPGNRFSVGEVYIIWGGESLPNRGLVDLNTNGADVPGVVRILGETALDEFGFSLESGDFNGDGVDDLAVGAWRKAYLGDTFGGRIYIFYGGSDWPRSGVLDLENGFTPDVEIRAGVRRGFLGFAMTTGDFNGDGGLDLVASAPAATVPDRGDFTGRAYVVWGLAPGSSDGPLPSVINLAQPPVELVPGRLTYTEIWGPFANTFFGWSMDSGTMSFDEIDDLVAGMPGFFESPFQTRPDGTTRGPSLTAGGIAGFPGNFDLASRALIDIADFDADSDWVGNFIDQEFLWGEGVAVSRWNDTFLEQVAIGTSKAGADAATPAYVYIPFFEFLGGGKRDGGTNAKTPRELYFDRHARGSLETKIDNDQPAADYFGDLLEAGSYNGDGRRELMIGARLNDGVTSGGGIARTVDPYFLESGGKGNRGFFQTLQMDELQQFAQFEGGSLDEFAASSFAAQGDLNGDGFGDMVFGSWRFDHPNVADSISSGIIGNDTGGAFILWGRDNREPLSPARGLLPPIAAFSSSFRNEGSRKVLDPGPELRVVLDFAEGGGFPDDDQFGIEFADIPPISPDIDERGGAPFFPLDGVWTIGGAVFLDTTVTGHFRYLPRDIVGYDAESLELYREVEPGLWTFVVGSSVDTASRTVTAPLDQSVRTRYALFAQESTSSADGLIVR